MLNAAKQTETNLNHWNPLMITSQSPESGIAEWGIWRIEIICNSKIEKLKQSKPRFQLSEEDVKEIRKVTKILTTKIKALRKRPGLRRLRGIDPVISQDPNNPDEVKICFQVTIENEDGTYTIQCFCEEGVSDGFCSGSSSPA